MTGELFPTLTAIKIIKANFNNTIIDNEFKLNCQEIEMENISLITTSKNF